LDRNDRLALLLSFSVDDEHSQFMVIYLQDGEELKIINSVLLKYIVQGTVPRAQLALSNGGPLGFVCLSEGLIVFLKSEGILLNACNTF
jgi:hypothetical protein